MRIVRACTLENPMKSLYKYFFRGLITILPVALTVYLLYIFLAWTETAALWVLRPLIGSFYIPGMGLVVGVLIILVIGYLVSKQSVRKLLTFAEMPFTNLPVVKSIYSSLKSFADYFSPSGKQGEQSVVILRMGLTLSVSLPASMRAMSSVPSISDSRCSPPRLMTLTACLRCGGIALSSPMSCA